MCGAAGVIATENPGFCRKFCVLGFCFPLATVNSEPQRHRVTENDGCGGWLAEHPDSWRATTTNSCFSVSPCLCGMQFSVPPCSPWLAAQGSRHLAPSRAINSSATVGPQLPAG